MCDGDLSSDPSSDSDSQSGSGSRADSDHDPSAPLVVSRAPVGIVPRHIEGKGARLPKAILQTPVASSISSGGSPDSNEHRIGTTHASRHFEELLQRLKLEEKQRLPFKPILAPFKFKRDRSVPVHLRTKQDLQTRAEKISKIQAEIVNHERSQQWTILEASRKMAEKTDGRKPTEIYSRTNGENFCAGRAAIHCHISKIF